MTNLLLAGLHQLFCFSSFAPTRVAEKGLGVSNRKV